MANHRYWRLSITAAKTDVSGVVSVHNMILAESQGGPDTAAAGTVTANSSQGGFGPARATDGDRTTNWVSAGGAFPRILQIDYGASSGDWKDNAEIRLVCDAAWAPQAPKDYTLDYSDDASSWTTVITVTGETSWATVGGASGEFVSRIARTGGCPDTLPGYLFYRLYISAGNDAAQAAVGEVEFRDTIAGTDRSQVKPVIYSQQSGGNIAANAFDNNVATGWFGTAGFPYWIGCELLQRYTIAEFSIVPFASGLQGYAPKDFKLQGSHDLSTWVDIFSRTNETAWAASPTARTFSSSTGGPSTWKPRIIICA
jgi:hypothetical protein